jgi:hypothetical protein
MESRWRENRIAAIQSRLADELMLARLAKQDSNPKKRDARKKATAAPPLSRAAAKKRTSRQQKRVLRAVQKRWPNGEWRDLTTEHVWGKVADELAPESKALGIANPSPTTVARALGRRLK